MAITVLRKRFETVEKSTNDLRSIIDSSPDAITTTDLNGIITECNQATLHLHGYSSKEDLIGKNALELIAMKDRERALKNLKKTLEQGSLKNVEYAFLTTDGREFPAELSASIIRDSSNIPIGFVAITKDVTKRKKMQDEVRQYAADLEDLIEEKTKELQEIKRLATLGTLAKMVGHDLSNPLQAIIFKLYLGEKRLNRFHDPEKQNLENIFRSIEKQVKYMNRIVTDLQDFTRPLKPQPITTNLSKIIEEILSTITIPRNVDINLNRDLHLIVDPLMIKRILINLITNAIQAMPNGGQITINASKIKDEAVISLIDTGVGIPEAFLQKIFKPLFTTKKKGQGLGLSVCKRLVEAQGGSISVESEVGKGTVFTVKIPIKMIENGVQTFVTPNLESHN